MGNWYLQHSSAGDEKGTATISLAMPLEGTGMPTVTDFLTMDNLNEKLEPGKPGWQRGFSLFHGFKLPYRSLHP